MKQMIIAAALCMAAGASQAATLTFDGNICGGPCGNGNAIDQSYGDAAGIDVVYDGNTSVAGNQAMRFWGPDYSNLTNVAYGQSGAESSISLLATGGSQITLEHFKLGAWLKTDRDTVITVTDLATNISAINNAARTVSGTLGHGFSFGGFTSSVGYQIRFGPDAYNVGIDNIKFSVANNSNPPTVPLPASAFLLLGAIGGLGAMRKRRG